MGNIGPTTQPGEVDIGWIIEPVVYIVLNAVISGGWAQALRRELQAPRSVRVTNLTKLGLATAVGHVARLVCFSPHVYLAPHGWLVFRVVAGVENCLIASTVIYFMWITVIVDYESNMKKDPKGQRLFTKRCIWATKLACLLNVICALGAMITGKLFFDQFAWLGYAVVIGVVIRALYSYRMIIKRCEKNLRETIKLRVTSSKTSTQSERSLVSTKWFDISTIDLVPNEAAQKARLDRIWKKVLVLLPVVFFGVALVGFNLATGWDFEAVAWFDFSKPWSPMM